MITLRPHSSLGSLLCSWGISSRDKDGKEVTKACTMEHDGFGTKGLGTVCYLEVDEDTLTQGRMRRGLYIHYFCGEVRIGDESAGMYCNSRPSDRLGSTASLRKKAIVSWPYKTAIWVQSDRRQGCHTCAGSWSDSACMQRGPPSPLACSNASTLTHQAGGQQPIRAPLGRSRAAPWMRMAFLLLLHLAQPTTPLDCRRCELDLMHLELRAVADMDIDWSVPQGVSATLREYGYGSHGFSYLPYRPPVSHIKSRGVITWWTLAEWWRAGRICNFKRIRTSVTSLCQILQPVPHLTVPA
jgi:hypothetical protein